ncbi:hypothetical protein PPERSA_06485 [Pseudocohnilembus persalinus]|uniref:JmjN domain-containing protein n=1 Tax=Pseudocohnilembus persalinus TaxID=266149 RepID=A0A0V0QRE2_PSEPJ|nr:hypothetical protein PPERSA_06485 [Pseudocohnilembus persalinus]|eukprot:KRX04851.1 hypothetical protein PPERSA_06485 [Pseudocohnilembus persalinus]
MEQIKIDFSPVEKPSVKEFNNFEAYIEKLENKYSKDFGSVKIIAPRAWVPRKKDYEQSIEKDMIPAPIEQNAYGKGGIYEMLHIIQKPTSLKEYKKKAKMNDHYTEGKTIEQVEQYFYKNIAFSPPTYGADSRNTLFDKGVAWNLGELDCILNDGLKSIIQGVNDPFLYTQILVQYSPK